MSKGKIQKIGEFSVVSKADPTQASDLNGGYLPDWPNPANSDIRQFGYDYEVEVHDTCKEFQRERGEKQEKNPNGNPPRG